MANYIQLDQETAKTLIKPYNIGELSSISPIQGGAENCSFLVGTERGDWCLTVFNRKPYEHVLLLVQVYETLARAGFPSLQLIRAGGDAVLLHEGKPFIVKNYIPGQVCHPLTPDMCRQLGEILARLHNIQAPKGLPNQISYGLSAFHKIVDAEIQHPFRQWLTEKAAFLERQIPKNLKGVFIHGDAFYDNILFQNDQLAALIDFEEASLAPAEFDLGMAALGVCFQGEQLIFSRLAALVAGYQNHGNLSQSARDLLPVMIQYAAAATAFWRFSQYHFVQPDPLLQNHHQEMVARAEFVHALPEGLFKERVWGV